MEVRAMKVRAVEVATASSIKKISLLEEEEEFYKREGETSTR